MAVFYRDETELAGLDTELPEKVGQCRADCPEGAVLDLQRDPETVGRTHAEETFGASLRNPAVDLRNEHGICGDGATEHLRVGADRRGHPRATRETRESREGMCASIEGKRERRDAAAVDRDVDRGRVDVGGSRDRRQHLHLQGMGREAIPRFLVAAFVTEEQEPCVLPRARMLDRRRFRTRFEIGLGGVCLREKTADDLELLRAREVRGARYRDLAVVEIRSGAHERKHLDRLCRRTEENERPWIAGLGNDSSIAHRPSPFKKA